MSSNVNLCVFLMVFRWPLWKSRLTLKGVVTHRLKTSIPYGYTRHSEWKLWSLPVNFALLELSQFYTLTHHPKPKNSTMELELEKELAL